MKGKKPGKMKPKTRGVGDMPMPKGAPPKPGGGGLPKFDPGAFKRMQGDLGRPQIEAAQAARVKAKAAPKPVAVKPKKVVGFKERKGMLGQVMRDIR